MLSDDRSHAAWLRVPVCEKGFQTPFHDRRDPLCTPVLARFLKDWTSPPLGSERKQHETHHGMMQPRSKKSTKNTHVNVHKGVQARTHLYDEKTHPNWMSSANTTNKREDQERVGWSDTDMDGSCLKLNLMP